MGKPREATAEESAGFDAILAAHTPLLRRVLADLRVDPEPHQRCVSIVPTGVPGRFEVALAFSLESAAAGLAHRLHALGCDLDALDDVIKPVAAGHVRLVIVSEDGTGILDWPLDREPEVRRGV
jgi:hypothetical protein